MWSSSAIVVQHFLLFLLCCLQEALGTDLYRSFESTGISLSQSPAISAGEFPFPACHGTTSFLGCSPASPSNPLMEHHR